MDRSRKGKKTSNEEWQSPTDGDARIVRLKDGRTRLGYKAEYVVDLETGAIVAAEVYTGTDADTATLRPSLEAARTNVTAARSGSDDDDDAPPRATSREETRAIVEVVGDKGYHEVQSLLELRRAQYRTYIPAPEQKGQRHVGDKGRMLAREAFHHNQARVRRAKGRAPLRQRGEKLERTFAFACESRAHPRVRLRGRDNARKRYLVHAAAVNLGLVMRTLFGHGTPRQAASAALVAIVAAPWIVLRTIASAIPTSFGMRLPRSMGCWSKRRCAT